MLLPLKAIPLSQRYDNGAGLAVVRVFVPGLRITSASFPLPVIWSPPQRNTRYLRSFVTTA